jgi:monoamine oxidase
VARTQLLDQLLRRTRRLHAAPGRQIGPRGPGHQTVGAARSAPMAGAGAGALRAHAEDNDQDGRVVVVGAGLAGLHCAYRLLELGVWASVYDAAPRVGGRVYTDRHTFGPVQHSELGGERIDTGHETMRDLAEELGIPLLDYATDAPGLTDQVFHFGGRRLSEAEILEGFAPVARAVDDALNSLADPGDPAVSFDEPNGGAWLDTMPLAAFLDRSGVAEPVRTLLEVAYVSEYGVEASELSALSLVSLISTDRQRFRLYGDSDERFNSAIGNDAFAHRLAAALPPDRIHLGPALEALRQTSGGTYVLTFARDATHFDVAADHVVLALPFTRLREVDLAVDLPPLKRRAIAELGYGSNAKLLFGTATRVWRAQGAAGESYTDRGYQCAWDSSRLQPGDGGIMTAFVGGRAGVALGAGTPEAQLDRVLEQIEPVFPGTRAASTGQVVRMHWPSEPLYRGSYSAYTVGQQTAFGGVEGQRVGNLHFCGEHTSRDFQGFMEGAALTGAMVAAEVAGDLGLQTGHGRATGGARPAAGPAERIWVRAHEARERRR